VQKALTRAANLTELDRAAEAVRADAVPDDDRTPAFAEIEHASPVATRSEVRLRRPRRGFRLCRAFDYSARLDW